MRVVRSLSPDELEYIHDRIGYYTLKRIADSMHLPMHVVEHVVYSSGGSSLCARDTRGMTVSVASKKLGCVDSAIVRWISYGMPTLQVPKAYRIKSHPNPDWYLIDTEKLPSWLHQGNCLRAMNPDPASPYYTMIMERRAYIKRHWIPTMALKFLPVQMSTINEWTRNESYNIPRPVFSLHQTYYLRDAVAQWVKHRFGAKYRYLVLDADW